MKKTQKLLVTITSKGTDTVNLLTRYGEIQDPKVLSAVKFMLEGQEKGQVCTSAGISVNGLSVQVSMLS